MFVDERVPIIRLVSSTDRSVVAEVRTAGWIHLRFTSLSLYLSLSLSLRGETDRRYLRENVVFTWSLAPGQAPNGVCLVLYGEISSGSRSFWLFRLNCVRNTRVHSRGQLTQTAGNGNSEHREAAAVSRLPRAYSAPRLGGVSRYKRRVG